MVFSLALSSLKYLWSEYSPQHPDLTYPESMSSSSSEKPTSYSHKTTGNALVLHILIFMFTESRQEDKMFSTE